MTADAPSPTTASRPPQQYQVTVTEHLRLGEDKTQEPKWLAQGRRGLFGAHWTFTVILVAVIIIGLALASFDAWVGVTRGLILLDLTLEAQAEAILAIVAVIAGMYATMRALRPGAKSG